MSKWKVKDVDAREAFGDLIRLEDLKFRGLKNVKVNSFNGTFEYTKNNRKPVRVENPNRFKEIKFEDNASYPFYVLDKDNPLNKPFALNKEGTVTAIKDTTKLVIRSKGKIEEKIVDENNSEEKAA